MELDVKEKRYFKCMQSGGRNTFARVLDSLFFSIICFLLIFCLFWSFKIRLVQALILAATVFFCALFLYFAYKRYKFEKFVAKELLRIENNCRLEKLAFSSPETFSHISSEIFVRHMGSEEYVKSLGGLFFPATKTFCYAFKNHPENPVGVQQFLVLQRKAIQLGAEKIVALSAAKYMSEASAMTKRMGTEVTLLDREEFLKEDLFLPVDEELQKALRAEIEDRKIKGERISFLSPKKTRAYLLCAVFFLGWYAFFGFGAIYPVAAGVCLLLALLSHTLPRRSKAQ